MVFVIAACTCDNCFDKHHTCFQIKHYASTVIAGFVLFDWTEFYQTGEIIHGRSQRCSFPRRQNIHGGGRLLEPTMIESCFSLDILFL